jgi:hypothetical protein
VPGSDEGLANMTADVSRSTYYQNFLLCHLSSLPIFDTHVRRSCLSFWWNCQY